MPSTDSQIARPGIWIKFPKVKSFLKSYALGPIGAETDRPWETSDLPLLRRYAAGERFNVEISIPGVTPWPFTLSNAEGNLHYLSVESVAYLYWAWAQRAQYRTQLQSLREFEHGQRAQHHRFLNLGRAWGPCVGDCLCLGWTDYAIDLARRAFDALDKNMFNDGGDSFGRRRSQHFVLRLVANWQGWPERNSPDCAFDEPIFNALLEQWREPDPEALAPLILAACDRHTQQCRYDNNRSQFFDITHQHFYWPFEILSVFRLRTLTGLDNPQVEHVVLDTPLGQLPEVTSWYTDELLEAVIARGRVEFPEL